MKNPLTLLALLSLAAIPVAAAETPGESVECPNLIYAGTKSSVCFGEEFLATVASQTSINATRKFKPVKLAESEVFRFPFAVMTGVFIAIGHKPNTDLFVDQLDVQVPQTTALNESGSGRVRVVLGVSGRFHSGRFARPRRRLRREPAALAALLDQTLLDKKAQLALDGLFAKTLYYLSDILNRDIFMLADKLQYKSTPFTQTLLYILRLSLCIGSGVLLSFSLSLIVLYNTRLLQCL